MTTPDLSTGFVALAVLEANGDAEAWRAAVPPWLVAAVAKRAAGTDKSPDLLRALVGASWARRVLRAGGRAAPGRAGDRFVATVVDTRRVAVLGGMLGGVLSYRRVDGGAGEVHLAHRNYLSELDPRGFLAPGAAIVIEIGWAGAARYAAVAPLCAAGGLDCDGSACGGARGCAVSPLLINAATSPCRSVSTTRRAGSTSSPGRLARAHPGRLPPI